MNVLDLCAGVGGCAYGLRGLGLRSVGYVERDAFAASVLVARMEDQTLDRAPVWDDLTTFDGRQWRDLVDLITVGLPCQPYILAGKGRANDDERALWPELVRIVRECAARAVFVENVPRFLNHAEPVWRELRGMGFEWRPPYHATAAHFGAPHDRHRVFLLATHPERGELRLQQGRRRREGRGGSAEPRDAGARAAGDGSPRLEGLAGDGRGSAWADTSRPPTEGDSRDAEPARQRRTERGAEHAGQQGRPDAPELRPQPTHPDSRGREGERCGWVLDLERQTFRHHPDGCRPRCRVVGSPWEAESPACRVDDGSPAGLFRSDRLRCLGNVGTPASVYAEAFTHLLGSCRA